MTSLPLDFMFNRRGGEITSTSSPNHPELDLVFNLIKADSKYHQDLVGKWFSESDWNGLKIMINHLDDEKKRVQVNDILNTRQARNGGSGLSEEDHKDKERRERELREKMDRDEKKRREKEKEREEEESAARRCGVFVPGFGTPLFLAPGPGGIGIMAPMMMGPHPIPFAPLIGHGPIIGPAFPGPFFDPLPSLAPRVLRFRD